MIFIDINFGQKGQIHSHMDGQISHITKMCSFNSEDFASQMTSNTNKLVLLQVITAMLEFQSKLC